MTDFERKQAQYYRDVARGIAPRDTLFEEQCRRYEALMAELSGEIGHRPPVVQPWTPGERETAQAAPKVETATDGRRRVELFRRVGEDARLEHVDPHEARRRIAEAILEARKNGSPVLYAIAGGLGVVVAAPGESPRICPIVDARSLRIALDEHVSLGTVKAGKNGVVVVWENDADFVSKRLNELCLIEAWGQLGMWPPGLHRVRAYPFFDRAGKLVNKRGFHEASGCYLTTETPIQRPAPGETPMTVIAEWLTDFMMRSFAAGHDATYAVAAAITMLVRDMIDGPTPLVAVTACEPGTGKGKLVDALVIAVTGALPKAITYATDPDRLVSEIITALISGCAAINLDNVKRKLEGEALDTVLTRTIYEGRLLGTNKDIRVQNRTVWFATANHLLTDEDMSRRILEIKMISREPGAATRSGWQRIGIDVAGPGGWTWDHRARILGALIAMIENWQAAKAAGWVPSVSVWKPGSYEAWATIVGEICIHAGMPGWGEGIDASRDDADPEKIAYRAVADGIVADICAAGRGAESIRWEADGRRLALLVGQQIHWAAHLRGKTENWLLREVWKIMRKASGRAWNIPAAGKRPAGILRFVSVTETSPHVGLFEWEVK